MINGFEHILIIKLSAIGDVVHTIPLVEVLRSNYPELKIDWCIDREAYSIVEDNPNLNTVIISNRNQWKKDLIHPLEWPEMIKGIYCFIRKLYKERYDIIIDFQGLLKSGIIAGICKSKRKVGLGKAREFGWLFVDKVIPVNYNQHAIDRYLQVAEYLGCSSLDWNWKIYISEKERKEVDAMISQINRDNLPIVAINTCARWKTKLWPTEKFSKLTKMLINAGCRPVFLGGIRDRKIIDSILDGIKGGVNLAGAVSLKQLAYFYSLSDVVVSVDTGPMHIAVMAGAKVVALFGPTDPKRTGPYGRGHNIIKSTLPCSPCFKRVCEHVNCMKEIKVDKVMDSVEKIMRR